MANRLPPPPINSPSDSYAWADWQVKFANYVTSAGAIGWVNVDKTGSNLTDIVTRQHDALQGLQGGKSGEHYHMTAAQHAALAGAIAGSVSSFNTRTGAVTLTTGDVTTALGYTPANTVSPTFTGIPVAPTAAVDTNTTQLATTAYVIGQGYLKTTTASSTYAPKDSPVFINKVGFNGTPAIAKPTVTGSRNGNAALASLLTALANYGLITDSTTA